MVHAMKMGWMKPMRPPDEENKEEEEKYYMLWGDEDQSEMNKRLRQHIPAPRLPLPGHAESYNPPPEYLMNKEEVRAKFNFSKIWKTGYSVNIKETRSSLLSKQD
jgi:ribosome biogenesis protein ERB1